ncbi:MAG: hypothetical protein KAT65_28825 [Methanophagales archaeon]|nr:hypothetical protein [Methanophagales archaeon]
MHLKDVPKPDDLMQGDWEESWIEVEGEVGEITSCPRCGSMIARKDFDVDFLDGKITVHGFEQMQCTKCRYIFMNAEQAQLYEDLYKHFVNFHKE